MASSKSKGIVSGRRNVDWPERGGRPPAPGLLERSEGAGPRGCILKKQNPFAGQLNVCEHSSAHNTLSVPFFLKSETLQKYL